MQNVKLSEVVERHKMFNNLTDLKLNVCDGYLYRANRLFRDVRDCAKIMGVKYTQDDPFHYNKFWLLSLPEIVKQKLVPYSDNVTRLIEAESLRPGRFEFMELFPVTNFVYHETNHLIADIFLNEDFFRQVKFKDEGQKQVLKVHLCESFAVAQDLFGTLYCNSFFDRDVFGFTTNFHRKSHQTALLEPILDVLDYQGAFVLTLLFFTASSMLIKSIDRSALNRMLSLFFGDRKFKQQDYRKFQNLFQFTTKMGLSGRIVLPNTLFRWMFADDRSVFEWCNFDFIKVLERNSELVTRLEFLAEASELGPRAPSLMNHFDKISNQQIVLKTA